MDKWNESRSSAQDIQHSRITVWLNRIVLYRNVCVKKTNIWLCIQCSLYNYKRQWFSQSIHMIKRLTAKPTDQCTFKVLKLKSNHNWNAKTILAGHANVHVACISCRSATMQSAHASSMLSFFLVFFFLIIREILYGDLVCIFFRAACELNSNMIFTFVKHTSEQDIL